MSAEVATEETVTEETVTEEAVTAEVATEEPATEEAVTEETAPVAIAGSLVQPAAAPETVALTSATPAEPPPTEVQSSTPSPAEPVPSLAVAEASLSAWIDAWQSQDLDAYFASYHADFQPRYQDTLADWRANRSRNVTSPTWIRLAMSELSLLDAQPDTMEVTLWLAYESPTYNDQTFKRLVLRSSDGRWLIVEEVNLEVRR
ncbi:MAG: hypothetical protein RLZZ385_1380 [Pseudomonadota bacterium]